MYENRDNKNFNDEEKALDQNRIRCPQKFFDLLDLAEKYQLGSMKKEHSVLEWVEIQIRSWH